MIFNSFYPVSYKRALIGALFNLARKLCSKIEEDLSTVENCPKGNDYPQNSSINMENQKLKE